MKSIVVGIDFQNQSYAAMKFAVNMAIKVNCYVMLVFVNKPDKSKDIFQRPKSKIYEEVEARFINLVEKYSDILDKNRFSYKIREGKIPEELDRQAVESRAEMIVVGTHGNTGIKLFSSSLAFEIVEKSAIPVVTIKDGAHINTEIKTILVPIDATLESRQKVPFTVRLAKIYNAEVHMLAMYHSKVKMVKENIISYTRQAAEYLERQQVNFIVKSVETDDIVQTTIDYSEDINADLISSMTVQVSSASNLWKGTFAEQLITKSHIPVLNIQPKELIMTMSR
ncbi:MULTISPECIES: universal stress protein [unclassified Lentimicrobium]|uniref:universal stress protein n=1 Tax=unclassified Lentimicrobium TaxID=2677434 RepID=UPI001557BDC3|nr:MULTISPECIES: universal stress protein [unclassified Lentimicrobium]NPD45974.1 universal stress protein [Lentimicrobium sp. S6]NPD84259.1 universal stress protein [Lentimicrobium sp. L6]